MKRNAQIIILASLITGCSTNIVVSDSYIPQWDNTDLVRKILDENHGNILSPNQVKLLKPLNKPIGWEFSMRYSSSKSIGNFFRYTGSIKNEHHFDYLRVNTKPENIKKYKWVDGHKYHSKKINQIINYRIGGDESCKFVLGKCIYKDFTGVSKTQYSEFNHGVWLRKVPNYRNDWSLRKEIYDASGFPLYYGYKSLSTGKFYEKIRRERTSSLSTNLKIKSENTIDHSLYFKKSRRSAKLENENKSDNSILKRKTINSTTKEYKYAKYFDSWSRKVERIGMLNYPKKLKELNISGDVLIEVALNHDGTVHSIKIARSSGKKLIDDTAIRIIGLAQPFAPFPESISNKIDLLHIVRVLKFPEVTAQ